MNKSKGAVIGVAGFAAVVVGAGLALWSSEGDEAAANCGSIAFIRGGALDGVGGNAGVLHVMNCDGSGQHSTGERADSFPMWSPDGARIAFIGRDPKVGTDASLDRRAALYVADADGSNRRALVPKIWVDCIWGSWSPDGRQIAFTRNTGSCDGFLGVYVVHADGSTLKRLAPGEWHMEAAWSPDSRRIAFVAESGLVTVDRNGGDRRPVAGADPYGGDGAPQRSAIQFSHDGTRIFFVGAESVSGARSVSVVNLEGGRVRRVSPALTNLTFALSPDGTKIAISGGTGRGPEIYVIPSRGGQLRRLTYNRGTRDIDPVWSPDSRKIAFTTDRDGNREIYTMNVDGSDQRNISNNEADDFAPAWRPSPSR